MAREVWILQMMCAAGAGAGLLFDLLRAVRRFFRTNAAAAVTDVLYWVLCAGLVWYAVMALNSGEIRAYELFGLIWGAALYFLLLSRYVLRIFIGIFQLFLKILLTPARFLYKIIVRCIEGIGKTAFRNIRKDS